MKRIQVKWLKMYNVIIFAILGILGFTVLSCSKKEDTSGPHPMYGVSSAEYIIQGTITDNQAKHTAET